MSGVTGARFSRLSGGARIGASYFERKGALAAGAHGAPRGLVDALSDLATPDVARAIDPRVAVFFLDTGSLELHVRPRWSLPFLPGAILFRLVATLLGQLRLPLRPARVLTRLLALDGARDGRDGARGVLRVYDDGSPMQVVAYAVSPVEGGAPPAHMRVAFPVPFGVLQGFLALSLLDGGGAELASAPSRGGGGVWLSLGRRSFRSPFAEVMRLWPAGSPAVPPDLREAGDDGATIVGTHEQTLFGVRFVRYRYRFRPIAAATARPLDP